MSHIKAYKHKCPNGEVVEAKPSPVPYSYVLEFTGALGCGGFFTSLEGAEKAREYVGFGSVVPVNGGNR